MTNRRDILGLAALLACALAAGATSPFKVVHPRSYPLWGLANAVTRVETTNLAAWISKSGKTGVGVTVMAERCGTTAPRIRVARAVLSVDGVVDSFSGKPAQPVQLPHAKKSTKPGPAEPPPPYFVRRHLYVPIPFDNERLWNESHNKGQLVLQLEVEGRPFTWTLSANQARKGYHRAVGFGAPPPCPVVPTSCPKPEPAATRPTTQPTVLERTDAAVGTRDAGVP